MMDEKTIKVIDSQVAFQDALKSGALKLNWQFGDHNPLSPALWMYMYTKAGNHYFKNILTRKYIKAVQQ